MDDTISRQATLEALLDKGQHSLRYKLGDVWELDFDEIREVINALPPEPRWIPCKERLPEEDGQYLITVKYKHVNDSYEDVYAEHGEWYDGRWDMFCFGHCGEVEDIIAWMPMPKPYRQEGADMRGDGNG